MANPSSLQSTAKEDGIGVWRRRFYCSPSSSQQNFTPSQQSMHQGIIGHALCAKAPAPVAVRSSRKRRCSKMHDECGRVFRHIDAHYFPSSLATEAHRWYSCIVTIASNTKGIIRTQWRHQPTLLSHRESHLDNLGRSSTH